MHVSPQTALRNRRIIWGNRAADPLGGQLPGSIPAAAPAPADRRDPGNGHCVCSSDHCTGTPGNEYCRGTDTDDSAHGAAALDLGSSAFNASTITYLTNCDTECCGHGNDCGDCNDGAARTADGA